jgi:hypothetical protein
LPAVAPLGEHLGGVDLTRPWQRREDLPVRGSPSRAATDLSRFLTAALTAPITATMARTASFSAAVRCGSVAPAGADRSRDSSSAAGRLPE